MAFNSRGLKGISEGLYYQGFMRAWENPVVGFWVARVLGLLGF